MELAGNKKWLAVKYIEDEPEGGCVLFLAIVYHLRLLSNLYFWRPPFLCAYFMRLEVI